MFNYLTEVLLHLLCAAYEYLLPHNVVDESAFLQFLHLVITPNRLDAQNDLENVGKI